jgi:lipoprotein NlpI
MKLFFRKSRGMSLGSLRVLLVGSICLGALGGSALASNPEVAEMVAKAEAAFQKGKTEEALSWAGKAIRADSRNPEIFYVRGRLHEMSKMPVEAIRDYSHVLALNPNAIQVYQLRGTERLRIGDIEGAILDFDRYIELRPQQEPHHWQRGIAYYYSGRFEEGRKQFELHQTVNANDVENAVWHFLCLTASSGVEQARAALIPIENDARVPMMQVHSLFAGTNNPDDVIQAAEAGNPSAGELKQRLFYAHFYLGLFYQATGSKALAREYIGRAVKDFAVDNYMVDIARIHLKHLGPEKTAAR